MAIMYILS